MTKKTTRNRNILFFCFFSYVYELNALYTFKLESIFICFLKCLHDSFYRLPTLFNITFIMFFLYTRFSTQEIMFS